MSTIKTNPLPENLTGTIQIGTISAINTAVLVTYSKGAGIQKTFTATSTGAGLVTLTITEDVPFFVAGVEYAIEIRNLSGIPQPVTIDGIEYTCILAQFLKAFDCDLEANDYTLSTFVPVCSDCV